MAKQTPYQTENCDQLGPKGLLIVGDCPGRYEADICHPFVGPSGRRLMRLFDTDTRIRNLISQNKPAYRVEYWRKKRIGFVNVHMGFKHSGTGNYRRIASGLCTGCRDRKKRQICREKAQNPYVSAILRKHRGPILVLGEEAYKALKGIKLVLKPYVRGNWKDAVSRKDMGERLCFAFHPSPRNVCFDNDRGRVMKWLRKRGF